MLQVDVKLFPGVEALKPEISINNSTLLFLVVAYQFWLNLNSIVEAEVLAEISTSQTYHDQLFVVYFVA